MANAPQTTISIADARIAWVIAHPQMSDWLKGALRAADGLDPTHVRNDVEILIHLIPSTGDVRASLGPSLATE